MSEVDKDQVEAIGHHIIDLLASMGAPYPESVFALLDVLTFEVASIDCPGCRKLAAETIEKWVADMIPRAVEHPMQSDNPSGHVH